MGALQLRAARRGARRGASGVERQRSASVAWREKATRGIGVRMHAARAKQQGRRRGRAHGAAARAAR
jgi:hypothetical protein